MHSKSSRVTMSSHQYSPCHYNTCNCRNGMQHFIFSNQWFCLCSHPLQQHQQINTINLSPSTNISVFNNSPSSYNHQIFPPPNQMIQSPFSMSTLNNSNMLFPSPTNIMMQTPNLQHQLMFGQNNLIHPTFPNPFASNNYAFNSPLNNNNVFNHQNFQTPITSNFHYNNPVNTQSVRSPGYRSVPTNNENSTQTIESQDIDEISQNAQNNSTQPSLSLSNRSSNSPPRYGLTYNSTTEREVNVTPVNNRMQNQLNREFRYESSQRRHNRNSRRSNRTTNSSSTNENQNGQNNLNELEITCLLYSAFENQQKYYLNGSNTEIELQEKDWMWQFRYTNDDNEPLVEEKVRE